MAASPPHESIYDLVQSCLDKDPQAWNEFVSRYIERVRGIALRRGFDSAEAADLCQDVFLRVYAQLGKLQDHRHIAAWLVRLTNRLCRRRLQRKRAAEYLAANLEDSAAGEEFQHVELRIDVDRVLDKLDPHSRNLLSALFLEQPSPGYKELSRRLGIAVGSIGPTRARCITRIKPDLVELSQ